MELRGRAVNVNSLNDQIIYEMYQLMRRYYEGVEYDSFIEDLREKDWVILMEKDSQVKGVSTQMLYEHSIDEEKVLVVFSGDTIIEREYWGTFTLPITWMRMMRTINSRNAERKLFWFLISKGFRTYRFLPTFFKTYFPSNDKHCCEFEKKLLRQVASEKFGGSFDPEKFIIQPDKNSQRLKGGVADITESQRRNRHIRFFEKSNPGYARGAELACITRFDESNLTPFILKRTNEPLVLGVCR